LKRGDMEGQRDYRVPCSYIALIFSLSLSLFAFSASFALNSTIENLSHINIGDATKIDEYVPTIIPTSRVKLNPLRSSPPNRYRVKTTKNVVSEVRVVLDRVLVTDSFITSDKSVDLIVRIPSLILSNTITVSL